MASRWHEPMARAALLVCTAPTTQAMAIDSSSLSCSRRPWSRCVCRVHEPSARSTCCTVAHEQLGVWGSRWR